MWHRNDTVLIRNTFVSSQEGSIPLQKSISSFMSIARKYFTKNICEVTQSIATNSIIAYFSLKLDIVLVWFRTKP